MVHGRDKHNRPDNTDKTTRSTGKPTSSGKAEPGAPDAEGDKPDAGQGDSGKTAAGASGAGKSPRTDSDNDVDEFGVSGYVHHDIFLIYDRRTRSLWYPLDNKQWTAISGPRRGETIPFIEEPPVLPLGQWRKEHPDTLVLLGPR